MYIDIQKFKKGQLYSRPEWNTETKKESIFCEGLNTYLLVAKFDNNVWTLKRSEALVLGAMFLHDDYFEVNDPLHYSHKIQESKLKEAIEEIQKSKGIKDILTVPCEKVGYEKPGLVNPYIQYGTGNPQITQPPVTSTVCGKYFMGIDPCKNTSLTEGKGSLQIINRKEFDELVVKLSEYYKDIKIEDKKVEDEKYDYAKLMSVNGIYDKDIVAKSEINILVNKFLQTIPTEFRKSFFEGMDFTEATVESTKKYLSDFSERVRNITRAQYEQDIKNFTKKQEEIKRKKNDSI